MEDVSRHAKTRREDFDSPWKDVISKHFRQFMEFYFPQAAKDIDWTRKYNSLDKEFSKIAKEAETSKMTADKLLQVWRKSGDKTWVAVHVEVQAQQKSNFEERTFMYNYRIYDLYKRPVASLAVLADENPKWRPSGIAKELWDCGTRFYFPSVKLIDWRDEIEQLEKSDNIFALATAAHLRTLETRKDLPGRMQKKFEMIKNLYRLDMSKSDIIDLYRFIDWIMDLPEELSKRLHERVVKYEEEHNMRYMSAAEQIGMEKGRVEGRVEGRQEGRQEGIKTGRREGLHLGRIDGEITTWQAVLQSANLSSDLEVLAKQKLSELQARQTAWKADSTVI